MRFKEVTYRGKVKVGLYGSPYDYATVTWIGDPTAISTDFRERIEGEHYNLRPDWRLVKKGRQYQKEEVPSAGLGALKSAFSGLGLNVGPVVRIWNDMRREDEEFAESERQRYREQAEQEKR